MVQSSTHETFGRKDHTAPGSERAFGIVMAVILAIIGAINWWHEGRLWPWLGAIAALLLMAGLLWPAALRPLNWLWFKFGMLLHAVVNPVVMGLIFFVAVWPTGLAMRMFGKDPLRLKLGPERDSYWIVRQPPGPAPESMKDQF